MNTARRILASTALLLLAAIAPVASSNAQGTPYCPGDGSWAACPCGNTNDGSMSGCDWHGTSGLAGASLSATGSADVAANDTILTASNTNGNYGIFFAANNQPTTALSDGLRCAGGGVGRLILPMSTGTSTHVLPAPLQLLDPGVAAGVTRNYQYWFRTPGGPCGNTANTTNGYSITWGAGGPYDEMVPIPAGTFDMGDHSGTGDPNELPVHSVTLDAFYMDIFEVSHQKYANYLNTAYAQGRVTVYSDNNVYQVGGAMQALCCTDLCTTWSHIIWTGSSFGVTSGWVDRPMVYVTWHGACTYANQRSRDDGLTPCYDETNWDCDFNANGYRLPTEAEWEYAARGGEHSPYYMYPWGDTIDGSMANYDGSGDPYETGSYPYTTPVGYYDGNQIPAGVDMANGYGLYDMSGNVWEWCWDWYDANYYSSSPSYNPTGPALGLHRTFRGGSWWCDSPPLALRSTTRSAYFPYSGDRARGFRVLAVRP